MANYSAYVPERRAWYVTSQKDYKNTEMENLRHDTHFYFCAKPSSLSETKP
jgi:hypothetical protein